MLSFLIKMGASSSIGVPVDKAVYEKFATIVKEIRVEQNLTQRQLASLLDASQGAIVSWERGETLPSPNNLEAIARIRGQLPEEFLAELYGRKSGESLQERITNMSREELSFTMMMIAKRLREPDL